MLTLLIGLGLGAAPQGPVLGTDTDSAPDVVAFAGTRVTLTLNPAKHRVRLPDELLDVVIDPGSHTLREGGAQQAPGPLLLASCSSQNRVDGDVFVVGAAGLKMRGPRTFSVFSIEPFATRFPGSRLRMLKDNGAAIFSAETTDVVQIPEDYRYAWVLGLDPTAKYRVSVAGKGAGQVLVAADLELSPAEDASPAGAAWSASRAVLKGGGKTDLPSTRQVAFTFAGVSGLVQRDKGFTTMEVTVEQLKAGTGALGPPRTVELGNRSTRFLLTVANQLLQQKNFAGAQALLEQCLAQEPRNAECHLAYARAWGIAGDMATAIREACKAVRDGAGTQAGDEARALLGDNRCR